MTNCMGASNIVQAIKENNYPIETVIAISTDKACKPINVMGMTKAIQERIVTAANILNPKTRFICVRYGNVLASRGSVIPLFHQQIKNNGPVTITDINMTRFLLSLDQAVDTVFAALATAKRGETYIPKALSVRMIDVAKALIGERDIKVEVTGIRPGEKIHEILISEEEALRCVDRGDYYAILPMLPELVCAEDQELYPLKVFSSEDDALNFKATKELLMKNHLMVQENDSFRSVEILR
jgi:FlaA1/EpsC-like NDP-sugar epimerase